MCGEVSSVCEDPTLATASLNEDFVPLIDDLEVGFELPELLRAVV
jgi:hypothetical protein